MSSTDKPHVLIAGGGLAGLAAAFACLDGGARVTLVEARPRLGGATWSFERNGLHFDNGQHVYLRCCSAYQAFLERLGTAHDAPIASALSIPVLAPTRRGRPRAAAIARNSLPAPLHLLPALARYSHLSVSERLGLSRAVLALMRASVSDESLDAQSFADFLRRHHQSERTIARLWDLICLPTLNVHAAEASLLLAAMVFKTSLLAERDAADMGWAQVPLNRLHVEPAAQLLERAGVQIHRRTKLDALDVEPGTKRASGALLSGARVGADAVIVAVPHDAVADVLPPEILPRQTEIASLGFSPIIDVHLVYDRPVMDVPLAAAIDSPVQFVFERSAAAGLPPGEGQCVAISVSGADAEHGERAEVLIDRYVQAMRELFPAARAAQVRDAVVSREHRATFRARPGTHALRAPAETALENVFVAGAWTDTGWPATMEGAVRSGERAAARALEMLRRRARRQAPEEVVA